MKWPDLDWVFVDGTISFFARIKGSGLPSFSLISLCQGGAQSLYYSSSSSTLAAVIDTRAFNLPLDCNLRQNAALLIALLSGVLYYGLITTLAELTICK